MQDKFSMTCASWINLSNFIEMIEDALSIRELSLADFDIFSSYWLNADESHLANMGVDSKKLPGKEDFFKYWSSQLEIPIEHTLSYCIIWEKNNIPVGHSSTRPTNFGKEAYMHLHLWNSEERKKGIGFEFIKLTIPHYFEKLRLLDLYCEPYALNPAPNRLLEKAGFEFVKEYITIPGPFNFEQPVKLWKLCYEKFEHLYKAST
jgi:RimJ/RimL family protein N-acetyltransferase